MKLRCATKPRQYIVVRRLTGCRITTQQQSWLRMQTLALIGSQSETVVRATKRSLRERCTTSILGRICIHSLSEALVHLLRYSLLMLLHHLQLFIERVQHTLLVWHVVIIETCL